MPKRKGRAGGRKGRHEEDKRAAAKCERKAGKYLSPGDTDFKSLSAQLKVQGLALKDVPGDGNCLFRALGEQLDDHHSNLRQRVVDHMRMNTSDYAPFLNEEESLESYIDELSKDGVYVGNDAIVAISRSCMVNIVIHQLGVSRWEVMCPGETRKTLHIAYLRGEHYCSVGPLYPGHTLPQLEEAACVSPNVMLGSSAKPSISDRKRCIDQVLEATGCKNEELAEQCLRENSGEIDLAIVELFQIMALSETCSEESAVHHQHVQVKDVQQVNATSVALSSHAGKSHLSNKERKIVAKAAKKHGNVMEKSDQGNCEKLNDPIGSLPI